MNKRIYTYQTIMNNTDLVQMKLPINFTILDAYVIGSSLSIDGMCDKGDIPQETRVFTIKTCFSNLDYPPGVEVKLIAVERKQIGPKAFIFEILNPQLIKKDEL